MQHFNLVSQWQFKQAGGSLVENWLPASVPGTVHQDLMVAGVIPDPFDRLNELDVQWVGETDWRYRCTFEVTPEQLAAPQIDLCFEGLDTFATVYLNEKAIVKSDNMFLPVRVALKSGGESLLKPGENTLEILFESAMRIGKEREAAHRKLYLWNGDSSRLYVRKAQYHYGWDWGPTLMTAGVWLPARLECYTTRIAEIHAPAEVNADLEHATLPVTVTLAGETSDVMVEITLTAPDGSTVYSEKHPVTNGTAQTTITLDHPALWYPCGYGDQARYPLTVRVINGQTVEDEQTLKIGFRRLRLVQEALQTEPGTSFYFEVNTIPLFAGGANWIPADNFLPRISDEQYRRWLTLAADAHMVMLRVWGGGIYETDHFYEVCDELGLLVWQDFMFACGQYPAPDWFQASVRQEAEAQVKRLRHRPSLVIWCGNNEDYQLANMMRIYDAEFVGDFTQTEFPARAIYEGVLEEVCGMLDPTRPYWRGSSYGGANVSDPTVGDRHTWEIWHGNMADYRDYVKYSGRFVSEFGMQAAPERATIETFTVPADRYPESRVLDHHNKATDGPKRLGWYLNGNLRGAATLDEYIYQSQWIQAEAVAAGIEGWRRRWSVPGNRLTAGALVWQLNDCWQVISWALVDSLLRPKAAYYRVKRALAPLNVGLAGGKTAGQVEIWIANNRLQTVNASVEIQIWTLEGDCLSSQSQPVTLAANAVTEIGQVDVTGGQMVSARLVQSGTVLARGVYRADLPKYVIYPDPGLKLTWLGADRLQIEAERPAHGVLLSAPGPVGWSDNLLDVMPGDPQVIQVSGLNGAAVTARSLADGQPTPT